MSNETQTPKNIWQHRISHEGYFSYPLLENKILSIGFSDFIDNETIINILNNQQKGQEERAKFNDRARKIATEKKWKCNIKKMRTHHSLWRFAKMRKGDWVLVPKPNEFSIYEIWEDNLCRFSELEMPIPSNPDPKKNNEPLFTIDAEDKNKIKDVDLGFFRNVNLLYKDIKRADIDDTALNTRMKNRLTTLNISALRNDVNKAINGHKVA